MIAGAPRLLQSEVGDQCEGSAINQRLGGLAPTDIRINPVNRRSRKRGRVMRARQRRLLKAPIDELHLPGLAELIARPRNQPFAGLDRRHPQAAGEQAACQLAGATADLEHHCAGTEPPTSHARSISASG